MSEYKAFTQKTSTPLIGALLRRPLQTVRQHIQAQLAARGFGDIHLTHLAVFQHPGPRQGARPIELAEAAGTTKQAMNHLLGQLEAGGYLERRGLARDPRGKGVWLTPRGEAAVREIRKAVLEVEAQWSEALGRKRYESLRALLIGLDQHLEGSKPRRQIE